MTPIRMSARPNRVETLGPDLRDTLRMAAALIEALPVGVFVLEANGTPYYANRRSFEILGQDARPDVSVEELAHAYRVYREGTQELYPTQEMPIVRALAGEQSWVDDAVIVREDGTRVPVEVWASPLYDWSGTLRYALTAFQDISERRRAEEAARRSERLASIGTLSAGIAHEINNPLQSILSAAEFALREDGEPGLSPTTREALLDIVDSAKRGGRIVRSVLQFARKSHQEAWLHDLNDVVRGCLDLIRRDVGWREMRLERELYGKPLPVYMNALQIEHVVMNVLRNAISTDPPCGSLSVRTGRDARTAYVIVRDDGPGMTESERRRAFDPFFTTRRAMGGTGLGLSLAHGIVAQHGGTMSIDSVWGSGTQVRLELPLGIAAAD